MKSAPESSGPRSGRAPTAEPDNEEEVFAARRDFAGAGEAVPTDPDAAGTDVFAGSAPLDDTHDEWDAAADAASSHVPAPSSDEPPEGVVVAPDAVGDEGAGAGHPSAAEAAPDWENEDYSNLVHDDQREVEFVDEERISFDHIDDDDPELQPPRRGGFMTALLVVVLLVGGAGLVVQYLDLPVQEWVGLAEEGPTESSIWVSSRPPNAEILVNGEPTGLRTPDSVAGLPVGQPLTVELRLAGWQQPEAQNVQIEGTGRPSLDFELQPIAHRLRVDSDPSNAMVIHDGESAGTTPTTIGPLDVPPGRTVLLRFQKEGYLEEIVEASWEAGQEQSTVRASLRPDPDWEPEN